jgi:hypothetical protein
LDKDLSPVVAQICHRPIVCEIGEGEMTGATAKAQRQVILRVGAALITYL